MRGFTFSHRDDIIGVSVKLTSSDTITANAIVRPKLCRKRPTMPLMKPTGTKIATSDSVVAITARPISFVALDRRLHRRHPLLFHEPVDVLEHHDGVVDDDADRRASAPACVSMFSVKPMYQTSAKVAMIDVGIEIAAITVERKLPRKISTTSDASSEPTIRCSCRLETDAWMNSD